MGQRLIRQVVTFIKNKDAVGRVWQNRTTPKGKIRQHKVVVSNDNIRIFQLSTRAEKGAGTEMPATATGALAMIHRQLTPVCIFNRYRPGIAVALPVALAIGFGHIGGQDVEVAAISLKGLLEQRKRWVGLTTLQRLIQPRHADVTAATFR